MNNLKSIELISKLIYGCQKLNVIVEINNKFIVFYRVL